MTANLWSIRKWSKALTQDFPLDTGTFLIVSIIPISYLEDINGEFLAVVDLSEINKFTQFTKQGCDKLVELGFAKWVSIGGNPFEKIAIGSSTNFMTTNYYFDKPKKVVEEVGTTMKATNKQDVIDIKETVVLLDSWFVKYNDFCAKASLKSRADKVHSKLLTVLRT